MCDCPEGRYCACEAILAYISQCTRSGITITWDKVMDCEIPLAKEGWFKLDVKTLKSIRFIDLGYKKVFIYH